MAELYNPFTAKKINQPALDEVELDAPDIIIPPEGFQVIEELLFPYLAANKDEAISQIGITLANIKHLKHSSESNTLTDAHIFDAMRLEVFRLMTLGISGFDSPIAKNSLPEALAVLSTLKKYLTLYKESDQLPDFKLVANGNMQREEYAKLWHKIDQAEKYILKFNDFDTFNRAYFITKFANPISELLLDYQIKLGIQPFDEHRFLKTTAKTLFEEDAFDETYFAPSYSREYAHNQEVLALGKTLFYDNILSGNNQRSCASCHQPEKAFTDGLPKSVSFDGKGFISRNAPTLLNAGLQASLFYEGRVAIWKTKSPMCLVPKMKCTAL